ncbi:elongation factor 1-beta'-like isoform X4 [Portunus trituberculatus]|uniref:elongation factor 1-beta'-like isoform X4 n=1 Tax=Portunus trituberculatus TaxID=210409 RepID=UPI001E1D21C2|nr:elongation factor 1-beta'-like isoform X4 [Portunus trituberculatus]
MALELAHENIWFDKWRVDDAERQFYEKKSSPAVGLSCARQSCTGQVLGLDYKEGSGLGSVASQIAKARQEIKNSLVSASHTTGGQVSADVLNRLTKLESENSALSKTVSTLEKTVVQLVKRLEALECGGKTTVSATTSTSAPSKPEPMEEDDDDDEVDLFGSDDDEEEDEAAAKVREQRLKEYAEKKSKKPGPIAKSSVLLDCKPWDDETDMAEMEKEIRKIEMDGLNWGAAKLVPLAFGIKKLSILCVVEDEKVSIDDLIEKIQENEDFVQSVDIAAFNKI